ncbi:flippase [Thalassotalea atypica]|uniref:flippase n=1 Tax=Thalassotalea atypica TaxID=2054316 RepID=UPI002573248F|nr:flippase [Thalassotalea atypica]
MNWSKSAQNSILLIAEKVIVIGFAFVTSVLLARVGGTELFGQYAYVTAFATLFSPLCIMGLNNIVTKYVVKYPRNSHYYVKSALTIRLLGAAASVVLGTAGILLFNDNNTLSSYIFLLLLFQSANALLIYEYFFLAKQQVVSTLKIRMSVAVIANIVKIIVIVNQANLLPLIIIQCIEYAAVALLYHVQYRSQQHQIQITRPANRHGAQVMLHKGKWLLLSGIAAIIYLKIDQIMLANLVSTEEVAYYAAAAKLSEFWYIFPILIANAYNPSIITKRKLGTKAMNGFLLYLLALFIITALVISFATLILSEPIIALVYGDNYLPSAAILSVHIFASIFIFQRALFSKWLIINNHLKYSLYTHGLGAVCNVLLNIFLIPKYGGLGAAWATLLSYIVASYISLFLYQKTRPFAFLMTKAMLQWPQIIVAGLQRKKVAIDEK